MKIKSVIAVVLLASPLAASAQITPMPADRLVDSFGVNVHPEFFPGSTPVPPTYPYLDPNFNNLIIGELYKGGVRHVRAGSGAPSGDNLPHKMEYYAREQAMRAVGIYLTLVSPHIVTFDYAYQNSGGAFRWEGANEPGGFCPTIIANQASLYKLQKSDPLLAVSSVPMLGPSLTTQNPAVWLAHCPTFAGIADEGNWHTYIHGKNPEAAGWDHTYYAHAAALYPGMPINATEYGYRSTQIGEVAGQNHIAGVPDAIIARYMPRWILTKLQIGYVRGFVHQIADNHPPSPTDPNSGFGLIDYFGTIKPQWTAIKNLLAMFNDPDPVTLTPLNYTVTRKSGNASAPMSMLFQRSDGHYMLPIWLGLSGWDDTTYTVTKVAPEVVSVQLGTSVSTVTIHTLNDDGTASVRAVKATNGLFSMIVTDHVQVLVF